MANYIWWYKFKHFLTGNEEILNYPRRRIKEKFFGDTKTVRKISFHPPPLPQIKLNKKFFFLLSLMDFCHVIPENKFVIVNEKWRFKIVFRLTSQSFFLSYFIVLFFRLHYKQSLRSWCYFDYMEKACK